MTTSTQGVYVSVRFLQTLGVSALRATTIHSGIR
jgi:hypothetical protein